ncbi:MAG: hypothetical protein QMC25_04990, partial [Porticoccaceae bacterium]
MFRLVLGLLLAIMIYEGADAEEINTEVFRFKVLLDDREVGQHIFTVEDNGDQVAVTSEASMD